MVGFGVGERARRARGPLIHLLSCRLGILQWHLGDAPKFVGVRRRRELVVLVECAREDVIAKNARADNKVSVCCHARNVRKGYWESLLDKHLQDRAIGCHWIAKECVFLGTFAPHPPQIVNFKEFFQSVCDVQTGAGVKLVICRMVLRGETNLSENGSDVTNGKSYLIRCSVGIKVPPAEGRFPAGTSQVNTCTLSGSILKFRGAQVLSHPVQLLSLKSNQ